MEVRRVAVAQDRYAMYGVTINDYMLNGVPADFETMVVAMATGMATTIEQEVKPLSDQATVRNQKLKKLGDALANLAGVQAKFKADDTGDEKKGSVKEETATILVALLGVNVVDKSEISKSDCERAVQAVKTEMDKLNNDAQADTTRLQSLVSKRDEQFTTASGIMSSVSDARTNAIRAMGG